MARSSKMTTEELLQMAGADLLGLLDETEQKRFEDEFLQAGAEVQEKIRQHQTEAAEALMRTLPDVQPPFSLKQDVLNAVLAAGGKEGLTPHLKLAGVSAAEDEAALFEHNSEENSLLAHAMYKRRVSPYWRAASLILGGMAVALALLYHDSRYALEAVSHITLQNSVDTARVKRDLGASYAELYLQPDTMTVRFTDLTSNHLKAVLDYNERLGRAYLIAENLENERDYEIRYIVDGVDKPVVRQRFTHDGKAVPFDIAAGIPTGGEWQIYAVGENKPLLVAKLA
ncbi:MAG TPA: hypothetical protein ENJ06_05030 [Phycisphaeraceae bacterium]|nr:hypothetical protein [Phycisphaeraceae bacterium]